MPLPVSAGVPGRPCAPAPEPRHRLPGARVLQVVACLPPARIR